jgi:hypothetical protein
MMKRNVEKLREQFERNFRQNALTKRGLPTKLYFEFLEEVLARKEYAQPEGGKRCQRRKISQSVNSVVQTQLDF